MIRKDAELSHGAPPAPWRLIAGLTLLGVALRGLLLWLALPLDIQSDEANYLYISLSQMRFDVYLDQHRYLWPPGYSWLLTMAVERFGADGPTAMRTFQVLLSGVIGATTMLFAWRLFSRRALVVAGALWAVHLPLAAYTHLLWTETVFLATFLPALWHLVVGLDRQETGSDAGGTARLLASGLLFGVSLYVKEMPLYLVPALGVIVLLRSRGLGTTEALRRATLLPLAAAVVVLPWTLRNYEVYGRTFVSGATLGENVYVGLNGRAMNFDFLPLRKPRIERGLAEMHEVERTAFTDPPRDWKGNDANGDGIIDHRDAGWERDDGHVNLVDRQGTQIRSGLSYAVEHPWWFARTRVKKLADLVAPVSFFTRHYSLGQYDESRALGGSLRRPLIVWSFLASALTMLFGAAGYFLTLRSGPARSVLSTVFAYVIATSLLVAMSRFRVPLEPFLLVLTAGFLSHGVQFRSRARIAGLALTAVGVAGLWWIDWPEIEAAARMALELPGVPAEPIR